VGGDPGAAGAAARGFIDLALRERGGALRIAAEAHSELRSIDRIQRRLFEKTAALAELGGSGTVASSVLLVRSTAANRQFARRFDATLATAFPGSIREALAALTGTTADWPGPTLLWMRVGGGKADLLERPPQAIGVGRAGRPRRGA
jgi:hypothetical protein